MIYSGEFHPFRLPVPSLWLDVLQKIKALGFSAVSFYTDWALLEGKQGEFAAEGIFALEAFFAAATEAGLYLIARPGPYINAEVSGGGFPGWLQRKKVVMRTPDFLPYTENYVRCIAGIIARAQITSGGPVILLQFENEYSQASPDIQKFPDRIYFAGVKQQYRDAGIIVPTISNDAGPFGLFAPGTGLGSVDIYGHDGYPLGFDCSNPSNWPQNNLPTNYKSLHQQQSPTTPFAILEFQAGAFDPWGGSTFNNCAQLTNEYFTRVFYKNNYAAGIKIINLYMIYGGTNWGNLGHPGGYTSYDYGAAIAEDRTISRLKYSEIKLHANFLKVSPEYLTAVPEDTRNGSYVDSDAISITRLVGELTSFYVVRHAMYNNPKPIRYRLKVPTSLGEINVPQLSTALILDGRDSKIHVTDYDVGGISILYSTAEIFTWKKYRQRTVLLLYGIVNETHEVAVKNARFTGQQSHEILEGHGVKSVTLGDTIVFNWSVTMKRKIIKVGNELIVYLLDRNDAYNYWVLDISASPPSSNFTTLSTTSIIACMSLPQAQFIQPGYLLRTATIDWNSIYLTGDINETTIVEVIGGADLIWGSTRLYFNGRAVSIHSIGDGRLGGFVPFFSPKLSIPTLVNLDWRYINSLPEVHSSYNSSAWPTANHAYSNNTARQTTTPVSLYGSDYGFHAGNLLFKGHFMATGIEKTFHIETEGGTAYAVAVFLDESLLGSFPGNSAQAATNLTFFLPRLEPAQNCTITVVLDNMGLEEDFIVGSDTNKRPRGILNYSLSGRGQSAVRWKITGNLGGEDYRDRTRGPMNEGGLYAERQGYHLPNPPSANWTARRPTQGIDHAGIGFFTTSFDLNIPTDWYGMPITYDIPMSFVFTNSTSDGITSNYRAQLYVNGYQFGKYVNNIGPQTAFPVPEGILNYHGKNYIALSLWALDPGGAQIANMELVTTAVLQTGRKAVTLAPMPAYKEREGAY